jgi:hypothetical protein
MPWHAGQPTIEELLKKGLWDCWSETTPRTGTSSLEEIIGNSSEGLLRNAEYHAII